MRSPDADVERIEGLLRGVPPESEREAHIEGLIRELRTSAPGAPRELRERVRGLKPVERRRQFGWKPVLVVVPVAVALVGAAVLGGGGASGDEDEAAVGERASTVWEGLDGRALPRQSDDVFGGQALADETEALDAATAPGRAQEWDVRLELAVRDNARLSEASADAIRTTRRLGGYVVSSNVATQGSGGRAQLVVRIPQRRVQDAIAQLSDLGTITGQEVSVQDRQTELDQLAGRIDALRVQIAELNVRLRTEVLDEADRLRLELQRRRLQGTLNQLTRRRSNVAGQVAMADVALTLETRRAATVGGGSRLDDAARDALAVLGVAAAVAVFGLIVLAPLAVLAALALAARRAWRRREDERLLDRPRATPPVSSG
jgi:hypothetical protein